MRIALCLSSLPLSGVGTSVGIIRRGLLNAQHDVDVVVTSPEPGNDCDRAGREGWNVICCGQGVRFMRTRMERTLNCLKQYDVVINNHSIETQLLAPCLSEKTVRLSVMRVITESALEQLTLNSRHFDAAVAISQEMQHVMEQTERIECPVHLISNSTEAKADELQGLRSPIEIAYVGRIQDQHKNIMILPGILQAMNDEDLKYHLRVAGDGPDLDRLRCELEQRGLSQNVTLSGSMSRDETRNVLKKAHFTLLPSFYEGLSNVMLESMALGSVPIVSDLENFKWVLGREFDKLRSPVSNAKVYAKRIVDLVNNPGEYARVQQYLWNQQQARFTPDVTVNGYLKLINDIQTTHSPRSEKRPGIDQLDMPRKYARQCAQWWRLLQVVRDTIRI